MIRRNKPDPKISSLEATMQKLYTSGKLLQYDGGHKVGKKYREEGKEAGRIKNGVNRGGMLPVDANQAHWTFTNLPLLSVAAKAEQVH
jgi:hypothetical protein